MYTSSYTLADRPTSSPETPSHSPPPPPYHDGSKTYQISPTGSDDSISCDLSDLSFDYEPNSRGEIVRVSKGSLKPSTPPTPVDTPPKPPSPRLAPTNKPPLLARSESLPQESFYPRQFQRASSGPLGTTPAGIARGFTALAPTGRKLGGPRRVRLEDLPDSDAQTKANTSSTVAAASTHEEKENVRAARVIRPARSMVKQVTFEKISEAGEDEPAPSAPHAMYTGLPIRPRRSASLSEAPPPLDPLPERPLGTRPGTSLGLGARRVTMEEKLRQERSIALNEGYQTARREAEEEAGMSTA